MVSGFISILFPFVPSSACSVPQEAKRRGPSDILGRQQWEQQHFHCIAHPWSQPGLPSPTEAWTSPFKVIVASLQLLLPTNFELPL